MTSRTPFEALVRERRVLGEHLVRLVLQAPEGFVSTGVPDEWVALTLPGQFQSRYYTVRSVADGLLILDVVVHEQGLVTEWAQTDCVGDRVGLSAPKGSFELPADAGWVLLAGDLTGLPAMARIAESLGSMPVQIHAEVPDGPMPDYVAAPVTWHDAPSGTSNLAAIVRDLLWPEGPGYFWMAGESAQMRDIRRHARHVLGWDTRHYDVMGYWSGSRGRQTRQVDPGPVYARGKAMGRSDEQIWADYDAARATSEEVVQRPSREERA
ncbi:MAG: siderophore-interacting protein [Marmoricola sp.]|jgi:NADPH-dependent ferric siderophore reductase|nr:siderophore-interacting protein [Marmoricola sp.]MCW2836094.1 siderophore-interacting protein [Marmoricola sp.]